MDNNSKRVIVGSTFKWVHLKDIRVDPRVQRELRSGWVAKRLPEFNPEDLGAIVLSHREDGHYVLDGQHRVALLRQIGWGDQQVYAEVFEGLSLEQEADVFLKRNQRITVAALDKFRVRTTAGDPMALDITNVVQGLGLRVGGNQAKVKTVSAVVSLEKVYQGAGIAGSRQIAALRDTLSILKDAWGESTTTFEGTLIQGLGKVMIRYGTQVDKPTMIRKLATYPAGAPGLAGNARGRNIGSASGRMADSVAEVIVDVYNKGRRGKGSLEPWKRGK